MSTLRSLEDLRSLYAEPTVRVLRKEVTAIDHHIEKFVALSPFVVIASGSEQLTWMPHPAVESLALCKWSMPTRC